MDNSVVGCFYRAWDGKTYYCDSYDPTCGYWMTEVGNDDNRRNVSERAIGRTFHEITTKGAIEMLQEQLRRKS